MQKHNLHSFLSELPKCEHHLHLEGCLTPDLVFKLAAKNNIALPSPESDPAYTSPESLAKRYEEFTSLEDFLQYHYRGMHVLVTESDFEMLAWDYFQTAHADGVRHAELFFDPQGHTSRGIPFETIVAGYNTACRRAETELGLTNRLIMCFLRHLPLESAKETLQSAIDGGHLKKEGDDVRGCITGLGLDSSEVGFPPEIFTEVFREGGKHGMRRTAHGGEEGDPTYISGALDSLLAERIDHGIRLQEDEDLMRRIADEKILLTICPLSNLCLQVVQDIGELPIRKFLDAGIRFSLNSDDPAYFRGYVLDNYHAVQAAFNLSINEWRTIAENSIHGSWIEETRKRELLEQVNQCVEKHTALLEGV